MAVRADLELPELGHVKAALDQYVRFKVASLPPSGMERGSKWSLNKEGRYGTGEKFCHHIRAFFGWAMLPLSPDPKFSGLGLAPEHISFGLLGSCDLAIKFWEFKSVRSEIQNSSFSGEARSIFGTFLSLTRTKTGWLHQTETLWLDALRDQLHQLGIDSQQVKEGYFTTQHEAMLSWLKGMQFGKNTVLVRDPYQTCKLFLDADSPMEEYIFPLIRNMVADRPSMSASVLQRISHERDLMMIVAFFAVPLRAINWRLCEIGVNIYRTGAGVWVLNLTREEFKNRESLDRGFKYHLKLPGWSQPFFSNYMDNVVPRLKHDKKGVQWLLPKIKETVFSVAGSVQDDFKFGEGFRKIFTQYFGFSLRLHSARHIIATDYLKADPNNLQTVAVMLNDKPETVRKAYAHLFTQDYATPFDTHMSGKAARVLNTVRTTLD